MDINPFAPQFDELPQVLPVFPLAGVLLLPGGNLPLNIFEPRYLAMIEDALAAGRMIGMVQPRQSDVTDIRDDTPIFNIGCAGKITEFNETSDGRYLVTLTGICRFNIKGEVASNRGYRRVEPDWSPYERDLRALKCLDLDRERLKSLLQQYFEHEGMECDWPMLDNVSDGRLITCLSMVCPFDAHEKQALLEAQCCKTRAEMFMTMLEIAAKGGCCEGKH